MVVPPCRAVVFWPYVFLPVRTMVPGPVLINPRAALTTPVRVSELPS
jgi:hypothetical protein